MVPEHIIRQLTSMGKTALHISRRQDIIFDDIVVLLDERGRFWTGVSWHLKDDRFHMSSDAMKGAVGSLLSNGGRSIEAMVFCGKSYIFDDIRKLKEGPFLRETCVIRVVDRKTTSHHDCLVADFV